MREHVNRDAVLPEDLGGLRLDQAVAALWPEFSRERLKSWIQDGVLTVDGRVLKPKDKVWGGEQLTLAAELVVVTDNAPQDIPLTIVYEDEDVLVLDKPAGLVVHPGAGNPDGTLLNALLHHVPQVATLPRAGIVHRIDKETSGLLVVAKTLEAQTSLVVQLAEKSAYREYEAVVSGVPVSGGKVEAPIGRHTVDRVRMAVVPGGKPAVTHYRVISRFRGFAHLRLQLETGRTHQIRVHMAHIGHPLLGDPLYGGRPKWPKGMDPAVMTAIRAFSRQALHAAMLGFRHPRTGEQVAFQSPLPADMVELLALLAEDARQGDF